MHIDLHLSEEGFRQASRAMDDYLTQLTKSCNLFVRLLANEGVAIASARFTSAVYDGNRDITVYMEPSTNSAKIVAAGKAVCFVEFGSGISMGGGYPVNKVSSGAEYVGPGTYSMGPDGKGHWADPTGWYYAHGKRSNGNPPAMAMLNALETVAASIHSTWRRAFG